MKVKSIPRLSIFVASIIFLATPTTSNNKEFEYFDNTEFKAVYIKKTEPSDLEQYKKDLDLLARLISSEAGNEPYMGKLAVGNVVMNRVKSSRFPNSIEGVVYAQGQFCVVRNGMINREADQQSIDAAIDVLAGRRVTADDVIYFYNPKTAQDKWIRTRQVASRHGNHNFAR